MEFLKACEDLAASIAANDAVDGLSHVTESDQSMWQKLFGFSLNEAADAIRDWRADLARPTMSQESWLTVKDAKVAQGFNKESYEYSIFMAKREFASKNGAIVKNEDAQYLLKLECNSGQFLESAELIRRLHTKPNILTGIDDDGNKIMFCLLTSSERAELLSALPKARQPTLIRISIAQKNLSATGLYPTLGVDTTLPQFRPNSVLDCTSPSSSSAPSVIRPAPNEYPVWYFFYGTLTNASILSRIIGLDEEDTLEYRQACVCRGRLTTWGEKYLGLVDASEGSRVCGWAYQVKSRSEEDSLRVYETNKYEVVRCTMELMDGDGGVIQGLTFRLT
ncbi:hypothetical protein TrVFT333_010486 [Trichoderma virens FT-333]|nr:hypothetical protein TrVFT333_010486 [Trichoderma virens FT-333]